MPHVRGSRYIFNKLPSSRLILPISFGHPAIQLPFRKQHSCLSVLCLLRRLHSRSRTLFVVLRSGRRLGKGILQEVRGEDVSLRVVNGSSLTWSDAVENILESQSSGQDAHGPMPFPVFLAIADDMQETNAVSLKRLLSAMEETFSTTNLNLRKLACS